MLSFVMPHADPHATALVTADGDRLTHGELAVAVQRAARQLRGDGLRPGQVVAVSAHPAESAILGTLAVLEAGGVVLPVDTRLPPAAAEALLANARPAVSIDRVALDGAIVAQSRPGARALSERAGLLLFTSGSSGKPKGVILSRDGLQANVEAILTYLPVEQDPVTAVVLPMSYSYALVGQAMVTLRAGGTLLLLAELGFPAVQIEAMVRHGARGLSSVPTSLRRLCEAACDLPKAERPALGYLASAGAALDATTRELMAATFPRAALFNQYGLTEACPRVSALSHHEPAFWQGSVGRPLPGVTVEAIAEDGRALAPGEVGELRVRGPSLMLGYLDDPLATERALGPCGLRSGDRGWLDEQGYLYVSGRQDGVVKCAGERVSLEEVAEVLRQSPGVLEAAVVAVPDDRLGHRLVAFLVGEPGCEGAVRRAVRDRLSVAKRPARYERLEALPRNRHGKVDLSALRERAGAIDPA